MWYTDAIGRRGKNPGSLSKRYRVVFGIGDGIFWEKDRSLNFQRDIPLTDVKAYLKENSSVVESLDLTI